MVLAWWFLIFAVHLLQPADRAGKGLSCVGMAYGWPEPGEIFWQVGERMPVVFSISAIIQKDFVRKDLSIQISTHLKPGFGDVMKWIISA